MARPTSPVVRAATERRRTVGGGGENSEPPKVNGTVSYTVPEVAVLFKCGERKVWQLIDEGKLASFNVGSKVRVSRAALDAFMASGGAPSETGLIRKDAS